MTSPTTYTEAESRKWGGDIAITSTVPAIHPLLNIPLDGTRDALTHGDTSLSTFYRGDIWFKEEPMREYNYVLWEDDGSQESRRQYVLYTTKKGFKSCTFGEWELRPELKQFYSDQDGLLVLVTSTNPMRPSRAIVMYRSKDRWEQEMRSLQQIDKIQSESTQQIANSIGDKRVAALPTTVEVTPHKYKVEDVATK